MQLVLSCENGTEEIAVSELERLSCKAEKLKPAKVLVHEAGEEEIARINQAAFTVNRVYILLDTFDVTDLKQVCRVAETINYSRYLHAEQTFGVVGKREGNHPFTSMDIARETGTAVTRHFESRPAGLRPSVHLDDPDVQFVAELSGRQLMLMINTSGPSLHRRVERPFLHMAGLKPSLAAALLNVSSWREHGGFLDPFCGGGTLPIIAAIKCLNRFPGQYFPPGRFLYRRLRFLDRERLDLEISRLKSMAVDDCPMEIRAGDRFMKSVNGLKENLSHLELRSYIQIHQGLAENLNYLPASAPRCIVTNPPYGIRVGRPKVIDRIYQQFALAAADHGIREVTALTPRLHPWLEAFRSAGYKEQVRLRLFFGRLPGYLIRMGKGTSPSEVAPGDGATDI